MEILPVDSKWCFPSLSFTVHQRFAGKMGLRQHLCRSCLSTDVTSLWLRVTQHNYQKTFLHNRLIVCSIQNDSWQMIISQAKDQPSSYGRRDVCDEYAWEGPEWESSLLDVCLLTVKLSWCLTEKIRKTKGADRLWMMEDVCLKCDIQWFGRFYCSSKTYSQLA